MEKKFDAIKEIANELEKTNSFIRKDGPTDKPYCVYSEQTGKNFGCYKTKKEAEDRLASIKKFKYIKEK